MTNNKRVAAAAIAIAATAIIMSILSYIAYPSVDSFEWASISPVTIYRGFVFTVGFGFGASVVWSYIIVSVVIVLFGISLYRITRRLLR